MTEVKGSEQQPLPTHLHGQEITRKFRIEVTAMELAVGDPESNDQKIRQRL